MEQLAFIGSGFAIVMGVLAVLWLGSVIISRGVTLLGSRPAANTVPHAQNATPQQSASIPPHHIAAIAGAVAGLSKAYRVVRIDAPPHTSGAWSAQDRLGHHFIAREPVHWAAPGHRQAPNATKTQTKGE